MMTVDAKVAQKVLNRDKSNRHIVPEMTAHRPTGDGPPVIEVKEVGNSAGDGLASEADGHAVKSANEGLPGSEIGSGKGGQAEVAPMSKEQAILLYSLRSLQVCVYDVLKYTLQETVVHEMWFRISESKSACQSCCLPKLLPANCPNPKSPLKG
jgi:hypothetical protein